MVTKTITYKDFNENTRTETYYFHLTEAEALELSTRPGFKEATESLKKTVENATSSDGTIDKTKLLVATPEIVSLLREVIYMSYGEKSDDGRNFIKMRTGQRLADEFITTQAYSDLFMELLSNDISAAEFMNHVMPQKN